MAQTAMDSAFSTRVLNATLPVGTSASPGTALAVTGVGATAMKLKITSTASTAGSGGTDIGAQTGYASGGMSFANACAVSSAGSSVTMPATAAMTLTATSTLSIVSLEILDSGSGRVWFGNWTGQPIGVAIGNSFSAAVAAISAGGF
jgi:hypothetical protein